MRPVDNCERASWSNKLDLFTTLSSVFSVIIRVTEECWLCCLLIIVKFNQDRDGYRATPQRWGQVTVKCASLTSGFGCPVAEFFQRSKF